MKEEVVIGLDIGTTTVKALAVTDEGEVTASYAKTISAVYGEGGSCIAEPYQLLEAVVDVLKGIGHFCPTQSIKGLSLSSAMHSGMLLDENFKPLTPLLLWSDSRSKEVAKAMRKSAIGRQFYRQTGMPIHAMSPMIKFIWAKDQYKQAFQQYRYLAGIKSFLMEYLTGYFVVDQACAGATGLRNLYQRQWDKAILAEVDMDIDSLPRLVDSTKVYPLSCPDLPEWESIPVMVGASDGCLATFASYNGQVETSLTVGTSAAVRQMSSRIALDDKGRTFCYELTQGLYVIGAASNNGGNVLQWARKLFNRDFTDLCQLMKKGEIGAHGLSFTPYLLGERSLVMDEMVKGEFLHVSIKHQIEDFMRAIGEGLMMNLARMVALTEEVGEKSDQLVISGGAMRFQPLKQILADLLNRPLIERIQEDSSAYGAAKFFYAYTEGLNEWRKQSACQLSTHPNLEAHESYCRLGKLP